MHFTWRIRKHMGEWPHWHFSYLFSSYNVFFALFEFFHLKLHYNSIPNHESPHLDLATKIIMLGFNRNRKSTKYMIPMVIVSQKSPELNWYCNVGFEISSLSSASKTTELYRQFSIWAVSHLTRAILRGSELMILLQISPELYYAVRQHGELA